MAIGLAACEGTQPYCVNQNHQGRTTMRLSILSCAAATVCLIGSTALAKEKDDALQRACAAKTRGPYGFQCSGTASTPVGFEAVTFIGTVAGNSTGFFDGVGTFNSGAGSNIIHSRGQAVFTNRCFGHIQYQQLIVTPGGEFDLHQPLDVDFAVVNGGQEILGTPVATLPSDRGPAVPRMSCRLVKIGGESD